MSILSYSVQKRLYAIAEGIPPLSQIINRWAINRVVNRARSRAHPLSTVHEYVS